MQKKILSLLLAFALVFGTLLPLGTALPAAEAQAATAYQHNAFDSTVYVNTYEELRLAVKNAVDNQTIVLTNNIDCVSANPNHSYGNLEFTVDGTVVLDMNGCSIRLSSREAWCGFRITGPTKLFIMNSDDEIDSFLSYRPVDFGGQIHKLYSQSTIEVDNKAAELYILDGVHIVLERNANVDISKIVSALLIYNIAHLDVYGDVNDTTGVISAEEENSDGIVFADTTDDKTAFVDSSVFLRSGSINATGVSVRVDYLKKDAFKNFKIGAWMSSLDVTNPAPRMYIDNDCDLLMQDIALNGGQFKYGLYGDDIAPETTVVSAYGKTAAVSAVNFNVNKAECAHNGIKTKLLSFVGGHFDLCLKCQATLLKSGHEADATVPCTKCGLTKLQEAPEVAVLDEDNMIEVATFAQFRDALRSNRSNVTVRLTADIFDASWSSVNRAEPIVLASYGNVIIDLNGHTLGATTEESKALLVLEDNYANDAGFANLVIMNSASKTGTLVNMLGNLIQLDNEKSSLTILPRVNLTVADVGESDSAVIVARNFAKLGMYDCEIKNINGYGICFDNTSAKAYEKSIVDACYLTVTSGNSCFSFGSGAFTGETFYHFSLGMASFNVPAGSDIATMQCNSQSDVKWSNLIKGWYDKKTQENKGYILAENIVEIEDALVNYYKGQNVSILTYGTFADCNEHDNANSFEYLLRDAEAHYASCHKCGRIAKSAHTKVSSCKNEDAIQCACGMFEYAAPHALATMTAREATCGEKGVNEGYYRCINRGCGKYFADANGKKEVSEDEVYIPALPHTLNHVEGYGPEYPSCTDECMLSHYKCSKCNGYFEDALGEVQLTEDEVFFTGEHELESFSNKYPTCEDYGVIEHKWCRNCNQYFAPDGSIGKQEDFFIEPNGHTFPLLHFTYKAETCVDGGHMEYYQCEECEKYFSDAAAAEELTTTEVFFPSLGGHTMVFVEKVEPSCTMAGAEEHYECSFCGLLAEDEDATVELEESDIYIAPKGHMSQYRDAVAPDCVNPGNKEHYVCLNCGETFTDASCSTYFDAVIPALGHTPGTAVKENEVAPECETAGSYDSVTYCTVCNAEASRETIPVAPLYHPDDYISVENKVEATCTQDGSYDEVLRCMICHGELSCVSHTVPALGHNYVDGKCTNCGEKEYLPGDVDGNGTVTAADARLALRASVSLEVLDEKQLLSADVDGIAGVTAADARLILRASVGLETLS
ncbi:MAG: hypothetical protein IKB13_08245 [Clostridia bacterium]|nr:hypothetical protein [Clostridia bacterium]